MLYVLIAIAIAIVIFLIFVRQAKYQPDSKGKRGENTVATILGSTEKGKQYVINDLLFQNKSGQSCQIDHVFINKSGIWVIETKNYSGAIFGQEDEREWTQVLANGNVKNKFYNPVKQNKTHIYHLAKYLGAKDVFMNVVVFLSNADVSKVSSECVYSIWQLSKIKTRATGINLSVEQMEYYYNKLLELKNSATISEDEHVRHIHDMQKQLEQGICPRCGGKLVLRNGQYGEFYGCSNYPKCKFKKSIK